MGRSTNRAGAWASPVTGELVAGKSLRFGSVQACGDDVYWTEARPEENGRNVLVRWSETSGYTDLVPEPYAARSRVHEYGGGEFLAGGGGVFFVNQDDQQIYRAANNGGAPHQVTDRRNARFADLNEDAARNRLVGICEDHEGAGLHPKNRLVAVMPDEPGGGIADLHDERDFYAYPRISPDGGKLAFLAWDLPHMPWEAAELWVYEIARNGSLNAGIRLAGGPGQAAFQPCWSPAGALYYVEERGEFAALFAWRDEKIVQVSKSHGDYLRPLWGLGTTAFAILSEDRIAVTYMAAGRLHCELIDASGAVLKDAPESISALDQLAAARDGLAAITIRPDSAAAVNIFEQLEGSGFAAPRTLRKSAATTPGSGDISSGQPVRIDTGTGDGVHALYYPPRNRHFELVEDELPPALVSAHGGPTGMADRGLKLKIQYWTSRGFAYLDVDYRGSAGYGRSYREALSGNWGLSDAKDVARGADWLIASGHADPARIIVSGSSAGGYTVLQSLVRYDVFSAGAAHYGISDLALLAAHTHKFESGYIFDLLGARPGQANEIFRQRSPIHSADKIIAPVIFLQGSEDKVVPPDQSRQMAKTLQDRDIPVAYIEFEGEGHGFRQPGNVQRALEAEYAFYNRIFGLGSAEDLPEIEIFNFAPSGPENGQDRE